MKISRRDLLLGLAAGAGALVSMASSNVGGHWKNGKEYKLECCSSDHKILTKNRGYVEAASLTSDDDIMIF